MSGCERAAGHDIKNCCGSCHAENEGDGSYMCDGYDEQGRDLHVCCKAAITSREHRTDARKVIRS